MSAEAFKKLNQNPLPSLVLPTIEKEGEYV